VSASFQSIFEESDRRTFTETAHNCPCQVAKQKLQGQQQPNRSIEEVIETRGFARKNECAEMLTGVQQTVAQADFEAVSEPFSFSGLTRVSRFTSGSNGTAILEKAVSDRGHIGGLITIGLIATWS
jgi:hypothetical protein